MVSFGDGLPRGVTQNGLNLGQQYSVANYPASLNPATAGLRNITCRLNSAGTVTVWGRSVPLA
jgi:hypothetical protein